MKNQQNLTENDLRELEEETNPMTAGDMMMELERRGNENTDALRRDCLNLQNTLQQERTVNRGNPLWKKIVIILALHN